MDSLYLHLGPGGNSDIDKEFIKSNNEITFWDQPQASGDDYIKSIICEAEVKVQELYSKNNNEKVQIIAHSFGAFIALNLNEQTRKMIDNYVFLAPTFNFFDGILNFINNVSNLTKDGELERMYQDLASEFKIEQFWNTFGYLTQTYPDYIKYYFSNSESLDKFLSVASKSRPLNQDSLIKGIGELLTQYNRPLFEYSFIKNEKVTVYIGDKDSFMSEKDKNTFKDFFGSENIHEIKSGHYPHIETEITLP